MKLLLDTCTFLWITKGSKELSPKAIDIFADPKNEVYLSAVSAWEITVKYRLGKLSLPLSPDKFIPKEGRKVVGSNKSYELREPAVPYGGNFTHNNGRLRHQNVISQ